MKIAIRRGSWFVTVPLVAAAVAYVTLSFLPDKRAIGKARDQIRQKQDYVVRADSLAPTLRLVEQELNRTEVYNAACAQREPAERELSGLYGKIHELAKGAGATITRFDPEPAVQYQKISQIPVAMGCVGPFTAVCGFLEGVESLPVAIWINKMRLTKSGENGQLVTCELNLVVFTNDLENSDYVEHSE